MSGLLVCAGQQSPVSSAVASHVSIPISDGQLDKSDITVVHLLASPYTPNHKAQRPKPGVKA